MGVTRIYVEKKAAFRSESLQMQRDLEASLGLDQLQDLRIVNCYDVEDLEETVLQKAIQTIFSEPMVDDVYEEHLHVEDDAHIIAIELLPGQYDQRADSAAQCLQLLTQENRLNVAYSRIIVLSGSLSEQDKQKIRQYLINPLESREASFEKPVSLKLQLSPPKPVNVFSHFNELDTYGLKLFIDDHGLAMTLADLQLCQVYFRDEEKRNPTVTEIRMIDTYWSDHCRHTTFLTEITGVRFEDSTENKPVMDAWKMYQETRNTVYGDQLSNKPQCLMDLAVIAMKDMRQKGMLNDLEVSEEINACSIVVPVNQDGQLEDWLVMFKNETHNHPTEIEPFGGAATCLGGAIRDPLSGRSYVYQAMRITGSGSPLVPLSETLSGKLPQKKITKEAARGFSSYGNQIGLATGYVKEYYHERFVAKRMELGAVIGAAPRNQVVRKSPLPGDVIVLVGGRTGRDGCGGATGSSKEHDETSLFTCGSEVQKGNAPTERNIQRLFRIPKVSRLIKKCNDFGAGGISVAIGELADGLLIDLDKVPKKYDGLNGTELAISESQERMAVVLDPKDEEAFIHAAGMENLEAVTVAHVTATPRLVMTWQDTKIVDVSRNFLDTNGAKQQTSMYIPSPKCAESPFMQKHLSPSPDKDQLKQQWLSNLNDLNVCSQKGLVEKFDSTIGTGTSMMPLGGKNQQTPMEGMAARIPVKTGETDTVTGMAAGYDPELACWSPFHGGYYAVVHSLCKLTAMGFDVSKARLSLQEYFEKPGTDPERWGKPLAALLGAFAAEKLFSTPAIGGKDSMSGTFKNLDVPPTLVSFAVSSGSENHLCSPEFKEVGRPVVWVKPTLLDDLTLAPEALLNIHDVVHQEMLVGRITAAKTVGKGGVASAVSVMSFGNDIGIRIKPLPGSLNDLFLPWYGSFVLEMKDEASAAALLARLPGVSLGETIFEPSIEIAGLKMSLADLKKAWAMPLESIFPTTTTKTTVKLTPLQVQDKKLRKSTMSIGRPRVVIPTFPGSNCEVDSQRAFQRAGALTDVVVFRNISPAAIKESVEALAASIKQSQILMIPGGFSAGDEPDGSGKFITLVLRNPRVLEAINELLHKRDGLILGICNGFQALIKLGLVPYGEIRDPQANAPTLTCNAIGRHISGLINTRVVSTQSPWFSLMTPGEVHTVAVSHGEGRFIAQPHDLDRWLKNGQVATQYVDLDGIPSMNMPHNPNGSMGAVESLSSPDGRVLGKMAHSERWVPGLFGNVPGNKHQKIVESGVYYYR